MSKKVKKVWLTEQQKNLVRGADLNDWNPVLVPSFFRLNVEDKELWPKIHIIDVMTCNSEALALLSKVESGKIDSLQDFLKMVVTKIENYRDIETGELIEGIDEALKTMPIKWLTEIVKASRTGGTTEEELTGVKS